MGNHEKRIRTPLSVQESALYLRKHLTPAERVLWNRIRNRQLAGLKFRRQHPLGPFVADFYCAEARLVVEVDGGVHTLLQERDAGRTGEFGRYGYRVIRFANDQVLMDIEAVLSAIDEECKGGKGVRAEDA